MYLPPHLLIRLNQMNPTSKDIKYIVRPAVISAAMAFHLSSASSTSSPVRRIQGGAATITSTIITKVIITTTNTTNTNTNTNTANTNTINTTISEACCCSHRRYVY